jgi:hypothetical protein
MSVTLGSGKSLSPSKPVLLFEDKREWNGYDAGRNARFVVARDAQVQGNGSQINVILDWFEELKTKIGD